MNATRFEIDSAEFFAALRALPDHLSQQGGDIVVEHGQTAGDDIRSAYEASAVTGRLARGVKVAVLSNVSGARVEVKSTAKHAFIFEHGTQIRKNRQGKRLGAMPPANIFIPTMIRTRSAMYRALADLLRSTGLEVIDG